MEKYIKEIHFEVKYEDFEFEKRNTVNIFINKRNLRDTVKNVEKPSATKDGQPELAGSYSGIEPIEFLENLADDAEFHYILGCSCGVTECWPLEVEIEKTNDTVVWRNFSNYHRSHWNWSQMPELIFDRKQYENEIDKLKEYTKTHCGDALFD
jgi:hypothetical protein